MGKEHRAFVKHELGVQAQRNYLIKQRILDKLGKVGVLWFVLEGSKTRWIENLERCFAQSVS